MQSNQPVKQGDVFYSTWGYDQTNRTFYQVLKLIGATKAQIIKLAQDYEPAPHNFMVGMTKPKLGEAGALVPDEHAKPMLKKIQTGGIDGAACFKIASYEYARPWDGKAKDYTSYA